MARESKSREHHWWPVALQKYWMDKNGDVSWVDPEGMVQKKRVKIEKLPTSHTGIPSSEAVFGKQTLKAIFRAQITVFIKLLNRSSA